MDEVTYHFTVPPPPRFGFCFSLGLARCAAREGADGPMSEYSSRDLPSGFFVVDLRGAGADWGRESALRMSDAETAMTMKESDLLT